VYKAVHDVDPSLKPLPSTTKTLQESGITKKKGATDHHKSHYDAQGKDHINLEEVQIAEQEPKGGECIQQARRVTANKRKKEMARVKRRKAAPGR